MHRRVAAARTAGRACAGHTPHGPLHGPSRRPSPSVDIGEYLSPETTCPHGCVDGIMRGSASHGETVLVATPGETLQAIIPRLSKVRGAPGHTACGARMGRL